MNHTIDLRKSNLLASAVTTVVSTLVTGLDGLFSSSVEKSVAKQKAQIECDKNSYYACAPMRKAKLASIERELTASGNAW